MVLLPLFPGWLHSIVGQRCHRVASYRHGSTPIPRLRVNTGKQGKVLETRILNLPSFSSSARYLQHFYRVSQGSFCSLWASGSESLELHSQVESCDAFPLTIFSGHNRCWFFFFLNSWSHQQIMKKISINPDFAWILTKLMFSSA